MKLAALLLLLWCALAVNGCASWAPWLEGAGHALAPSSQGGAGGAETAGSVLPEPFRTPVTAIGGATGMLLLAIARNMQRKGQALDAITEGLKDAPAAARHEVTAAIKTKARRRGVNDVIEARIQR